MKNFLKYKTKEQKNAMHSRFSFYLHTDFAFSHINFVLSTTITLFISWFLFTSLQAQEEPPLNEPSPSIETQPSENIQDPSLAEQTNSNENESTPSAQPTQIPETPLPITKNIEEYSLLWTESPFSRNSAPIAETQVAEAKYFLTSRAGNFVTIIDKSVAPFQRHLLSLEDSDPSNKLVAIKDAPDIKEVSAEVIIKGRPMTVRYASEQLTSGIHTENGDIPSIGSVNTIRRVPTQPNINPATGQIQSNPNGEQVTRPRIIRRPTIIRNPTPTPTPTPADVTQPPVE